jgi:hypothetical protein
VIIGGNPGNAPFCIGNGLPSPTSIFTAPAGLSSYKWTVDGAIEIVGDDASASVTVEVNGVGTLYLHVVNEFGCESTCQKSILVQSGAPCSLNGPEQVCAETENVYTDESLSEDGTIFQWSLVDGDGNPVSSDVAYFIGATDGSSVTVKAGVNGGSYVVRLFKEEPGACPSICIAETNIIPRVNLSADAKNPKCFEGEGQITFSATGGTGAISYTVNAASATSPFSALAGTYAIIATDENGCKADTTITITEPAELVASIEAGTILCNGGTTTVTVSATGGTPTYTGTGTFTVGVGTHNYTVTDANGCTDEVSITLTEPDAVVLTASGPDVLCTTETGSITFSAVGGTGSISFTVNSVSATSPFTASSGTYTIVATDANNCTDTKVVTIASKQCGVPYCTYTQGYFGNIGGIACTPAGSRTTTQLITGSLANMPGGILYLGVSGRSFTATNAADIIRILPGGGSANRLPNGNHTPGSNQILKKGKVNNVLLSQTIALALNTYMQGSTLGSLSLADGGGSADKYIIVADKKGGDCSSLSTAVPADCKFSPVYCSDGITISGYTTTYNPYKTRLISSKVINALPGSKTVLDLLNLASAALGGTLPAGVSYSDVAGAAALINEVFDECKLFVGFSSTSNVSGYCTPPAGSPCPAPIITTRNPLNSNITAASVEVKEVEVNAFPNPFREQLNFRFVSPVSGKAVLEVYNVHGQRLGIVFDGNVTAGTQNFARFSNETHATGMLIYKLSVADQVLTGKVQSLK